MLNGIQTWFAGHGVDTTDFFASYVDVDRITSSVSTVLSSVVDAFSNVVLILLIVLFMIAQVYSFPRKAYSQLSLSKRFERSFKDFTDFTRSYLFTKGWLALLATLASTGIYYRLRSGLRPTVGPGVLRPQLHPQLRFHPLAYPPVHRHPT